MTCCGGRSTLLGSVRQSTGSSSIRSPFVRLGRYQYESNQNIKHESANCFVVLKFALLGLREHSLDLHHDDIHESHLLEGG